MEEYHHDRSSTPHRVSFLYSPISSSSTKNNNNNNNNIINNNNNKNNHHPHHHQHMLFPHMSSLLPQSGQNCFRSDHDQTNSPVKSEASSSRINHYSLLMKAIHNTQEASNHSNNDHVNHVEAMKAKIIAHPHYSTLLQAYLDCQKIGAPPEVIDRITATRQDFEAQHRSTASVAVSRDPELDQFMVIIKKSKVN